MNRRNLLLGASAAAATPMMPRALADASQPSTYDEAVRLTWRPLDPSGGVRELVRAATLAANSHNTQPWRFGVSEDRITLRPDFSRRCPAVDPDDHHLFASLGCAVENAVQAAALLGFKADARLDPAEAGSIVIGLDRAPASRNLLAEAITRRQSTRGPYDGKALGADDLRTLQAAGTLDGVDCLILTDRSRIEAVLDYVVRGNTAQMRDEAFMAELIDWIRFSDAMAIERLDGLSARSSGNPSLPGWLARRLLSFVFTEKGENDKYAGHIRSSAGIAVFASSSNDRKGWIAAGRACQRFALQATALDVRLAFINQPVEVATLRPQIAAYLQLGDRRPDLIVRFGRGATLPPSLRRPASTVIDSA